MSGQRNEEEEEEEEEEEGEGWSQALVDTSKFFFLLSSCVKSYLLFPSISIKFKAQSMLLAILLVGKPLCWSLWSEGLGWILF